MSISIISISLPTELLVELDGILGENKSANRSEVLRQAVRSYITDYKELDNVEGNIIATVSVLYEKKEHNEELFRLQHEFSDMITTYLHSHLTESSCLEIMVVKGPSKRLKNLIDGLKANKPVTQIKFSIMTSAESK